MTSLRSRASDLPGGREFRWIADGLALGGDYNPEQWTPDIWRQDVDLMRRAGVNSVNLGVFSWGLIEVADGVFDFGWLDEVMGLLHEGGIGVNLATPTAAPPIWLHKAHPEILPVDDRGVRYAPGGRLGWYPSSSVFRRYALRMVERLAEHVAQHPALRMWHVSNELGNENPRSYDEETAEAFRVWLRDRFGAIDDLNRAWGTAFWGHHYTGFEQVDPPRFCGTGHNPALLLDFERFSSDALLGHYRAEREVLRRITPHVPVTTNFMIQSHPGVADYAAWAAEMDVVANDHYTQGADPRRHIELAFAADRSRGIAGGDPWLLIEHSTSAVNWQPRNRAKEPGELLRDSLSHIARGSDGALFFQWRQSTAGAEQFHSAVVPHAGPDTKVYREVAELGRIMGLLAQVQGSRVERAKVALLFSFDSAAALRSGKKPTADVNSVDVALAYYAELFDRGIAVDVIPPGADLDGYDLILVPTLFLVSDEDAARIATAAENGATVLVTPFSGIVDQENRVRSGGYPGAFRELLGVSMEEFFPLQSGETVTLDNGWSASGWTELGRVTDAEVLASYAGGALAGSAAVTSRAVGAGRGVYVSTWLDAAAIAALLDDVAAAIAPVAEGSRGVARTRRIAGDGRRWLFAVNHSDRPATVSVHGTEVVSGRTVTGADTVSPGAVGIYLETACAVSMTTHSPDAQRLPRPAAPIDPQEARS